MDDVHWSSRVGTSSWRIKHTTRAATTASNPHCESQLSRIIVSAAAVHLQTVPQRIITSSIHGPEALVGQTAVTRPGHWRNSHSQSVATSARKNLEICKRTTPDPFAFPITDDPRKSTCRQGSTKRDGSRGGEEPRRQLRRTASRTKQREGGASGSTTVVPKPKGDGKVESCSRPSTRRIRRCETYPRRCGTLC